MSEESRAGAVRWDARYGDPRSDWTYQPDDLVVTVLKGFDPGRALDVGCGTGGNALWLTRLGWSVLGVDFSPHAVAAARRGASDLGLVAEFLVVDITQRVDLGQFDLVLVNYGLPAPSRGRKAALTFIDQALAPGGTLLMIDYASPIAAQGDSGGVSARELQARFADFDIITSLHTRRGENVTDSEDQSDLVGVAPGQGWHPDVRDDATYSDPHEATIFLASKPSSSRR